MSWTVSYVAQNGVRWEASGIKTWEEANVYVKDTFRLLVTSLKVEQVGDDSPAVQTHRVLVDNTDSILRGGGGGGGDYRLNPHYQAWEAVAKVLHEVLPDWTNDTGKTPTELAVTAIKHLAFRKTEHWRAIVDALNEAYPDWIKHFGPGVDAALKAIKAMKPADDSDINYQKAWRDLADAIVEAHPSFWPALRTTAPMQPELLAAIKQLGKVL